MQLNSLFRTKKLREIDSAYLCVLKTGMSEGLKIWRGGEASSNVGA